MKSEARILPPPDWKAEQKASKAVHVEFPMFGKKMLCGRLLRDFVEGEQYIWTDKANIRCPKCRKEGRRLRLWEE